MKIIIKLLFYLALFALLAFLLMYLFFQEQYQSLSEEYLRPAGEEEVVKEKTLTIGFAFGPESLEPTLNDPVTKNRILK